MKAGRGCFRPDLKWALQFGILVTGLAIAAAGVLLTVNTTWGVSPWDVLHKALSERSGIRFGTVQQMVGVVVLLGTLALGGHRLVRLGTLMNIFLIGQCVKWFSHWFGWFPVQAGSAGLAQLVLGISVMGFGVALYLSAGLGAGPRDGLLLMLVQRTRGPVWLVKIALDGAACLAGTLLGGPVGFGTIIYVLLYGINIHFFLGLLKRWLTPVTGRPGTAPASFESSVSRQERKGGWINGSRG